VCDGKSMQKKLHFLIIDDIETMRLGTSNMLKNSLQDAGIEADVMESDNAEDAIADLSVYCENLDAVFMAWNLPDINGADLLSLIRNNEDFEHIKIIVTGSEKYKDEIKENRVNGVHGYLIKPYTQKDVNRVLTQIKREHMQE
jgi:two-component system chemotaxis response regulator CheY